MLAVEIDHDVLAAIIGALALILVAYVPKTIAKAVNRRTEVVSLREAVDDLIRSVNEQQERRHAEHAEMKAMLQGALEVMQSTRPRRTNSR